MIRAAVAASKMCVSSRPTIWSIVRPTIAAPARFSMM
jgi:hypothetical protein